MDQRTAATTRQGPDLSHPSGDRGGVWALWVLLLWGCGSSCAPVARQTAAEDPTTLAQRVYRLASLPHTELRNRASLLRRQLSKPKPNTRCDAHRREQLAELYDALRAKALRTALAQTEQVQRLSPGHKASVQRLRQRRARERKRASAWLARALDQRLRSVRNPHCRYVTGLDLTLLAAAGNLADDAADLRARKRPVRAAARERDQQGLLSRLLREHHTSRLVPVALLHKAIILRRRGELATSILLYQKVLTGPATRLHTTARIGLAHCLMGLHKYRRAVRLLVPVAKGSGDLQLRDEARAVLTEAWVRCGRPKQAYALMSQLTGGRPRATRELFVRLAEWCHRHQYTRLALALHREALRRWPADDRRCDWWRRTIDGAMQLHYWEELDTSLGVTTTGRKARRLAAGLRRCLGTNELLLKRVATGLHQQGTRAKDAMLLHSAHRYYRAFLQTHAKSDHAYLMARQHASLLWQLQHLRAGPGWVAVARGFRRAVQMPRPRRMSLREYHRKRAADALSLVRSMMRANAITNKSITSFEAPSNYKTCVRRRRRRCLAWRTAPSSPQPLRRGDQQLLSALELYLKLVPKSKYRGAVLFNMGYIYWKANQHDKARPLLLRVALHHAKDMPQAARAAAFRVIGVLSMQRRYKELLPYLDKFMANRSLMQDEVFESKMRDFRLKAMWADADRLRTQKRWAACGAAFEKIATRYPLVSGLDLFFYNAGMCYEAANMLAPSVRMLRTLVRRFRRSRHRALAMYFVAGNFDQLAFFKQAGQWYERFIKQYPQRKEAPVALWRAVELNIAQGELALARQLGTSISGHIAKRKPALEARIIRRLIQAHDAAGAGQETTALIQIYLKRFAPRGPVDRTIEVRVRWGALLWRQRSLGNPALVTQARTQLLAALRLWNQGRALRKIPAKAARRSHRVMRLKRTVLHARYLLAETQRESAMRIQLPAGLRFSPRRTGRSSIATAKLKAWLTQKTKRLDRIAALYRSLLPLAKLAKPATPAKPDRLRQLEPWLTAAAARVGEVYQRVSDGLVKLPTPATVRTRPARRAYRAQLKRIAHTLLRRAKPGFQNCARLASRLRLINRHTRHCRTQLARISPRTHSRNRERLPSPPQPRLRVAPADFDHQR